jgi:uncharacterized protein
MLGTMTEPARLPPRGEFRPSRKLLTLYVLRSLLATVAFPFVLLPLYFRYLTLRYRFDEEGISAAWGLLFRREVFLTYRRIQDIHVSAGILQRWLGLGTVEVQTASGTSSAEISIEGMENFVELRDYLYARMRGVAEDGGAAKPVSSTGPSALLLREIRDDLRQVRRALEGK